MPRVYPDYVAARLIEAARTMRHVSISSRDAPTDAIRAAWPETVRTWYDYGRDPAPHTRIIPSGYAIDRMDEAVRWLLWLNDTERKLVWWKAVRPRRSWPMPLVRSLGLSKRTAYRRHGEALITIALKLSENPRRKRLI